MLTFPIMTARKISLAFLLAVFFSPTAHSHDSSLYSLESSLNDLVFRLSQSVVTVESSRRVSDGSLDVSGPALERVVSSGVVCDSAGRIIVAARAVLDKDQILVIANDRMTPAQLVAVDYQNELALLQCPPGTGSPVCYVENRGCTGQMVVAVGSAYGVRAAPFLGFCAGAREDGTLQFSVQTSSGAIGGGVFDLSGCLLGIIIGGIGSDNRGTLAVPAYRIPGTVSDLVTHGDRQSGYMGISTREIEITPGIPVPQAGLTRLASVGYGDVIERGVAVTSVVPGSPASMAGLIAGDLIYAIDGVAINSAPGLARLVGGSQPGTRIEVSLIRQNRYYAIPVVMERKNLNPLPMINTHGSQGFRDDHINSLRRTVQTLKNEIQHLEYRLRQLE